MNEQRYSTPAAFKQALDQRLRNMTKSGAEFARKRQLLVFERFLARIVAVFGESVLLKGGLVLELRLDRARTTKDIDLRMTGSPENVLSKLQEAGRLDLGDYMTFEIAPDRENPEIVGDGVLYDGYRFRSECRLAGKLYGQHFGVDVAFGDPIWGTPDLIAADDILAFANISPPLLRLYPLVTHIAEKFHAYTLPRQRPNTRVKDLPDIALLATVCPIDAKQLHSALEKTFSFRNSHTLPDKFPDPPSAWNTAYEAMALQDQLRWSTLDRLTQAVQTFLDPILASDLSSVWNPDLWKWESKH